MDNQNKNLILATALSFLVILVWFVLFPPPEAVEQPAAQAEASTTQPVVPNADGSVPVTPAPQATPISAEESLQNALAASERVAIETPRLRGSLSLTGARIDDLELVEYNVRLDDPSEKVRLLNPAGGPNAYYALYGWAPGAGLDYDAVPGAKTAWQVESGGTLTPETPVTLVWDNGQGQIFRRVISVDDGYLFDIRQTVQNTSANEIALAPYGIIARHNEPETIGFYILHEGVVRAQDGQLQEIDYADMPDQDFDAREQAAIDAQSVSENGWIGFTDKYWMTTLLPAPGQSFTSVSKYSPSSNTYQTDMRLPVMRVAAGETAEITTALFAGAKEWEAIRGYEERRGYVDFIDSIDWGWFYFLTKPIFWVLHYLNGLIGNMGWAIIGLTVIIKLLLFPLAYKSYASMARMKEVQPEIEKIKARVGDDRQKLQMEMMALYKERKINPAAGCLPILLQIPIFFSLYKVIFVTIELRHAPFIGWIKDLSAPDPSSWLNLFGLLPYDVSWAPALISIGIWPVLMGITMWLQQKLNPAPTDATQAMIFAWLPWVFMFMLGGFASGLVIYWVANNTLTFTQQYLIMRSHGYTPDIFGNIRSSFKKKQNAK